LPSGEKAVPKTKPLCNPVAFLANLNGAPCRKHMVLSSETVAARSGRCCRIATALTTLLCPLTSPTLFPLSAVKQWPYRSRPSPTPMTRWLSPSQAMSLMRPEMIEYSPLVLTASTASHTRTWPDTSPDATQNPEGEKRATVVVVV
jgi:hypothetical protein